MYVPDAFKILDAGDVRAMGGQEAVYRFRAGLGRGFADGGAVVGSSMTMSPVVSLAGANVTLRDVHGTFLGRLRVEADNRIALIRQHREPLCLRLSTLVQLMSSCGSFAVCATTPRSTRTLGSIELIDWPAPTRASA
jgi:hypothetical protein